MEIQSLSVAVPANCLNDCEFCVAKMHRGDYANMYEENKRFFHLYSAEFMKKLEYVRDYGCHCCILTGDGEPILNYHFLKDFGFFNRMIKSPFKFIEIQTSGVLLTEKDPKKDSWRLRFLREHVGVSTISLSLSDIFSSEYNSLYNRTKKGFEVDIDKVCSEIKRYDFNLRLSLNMTDRYNQYFSHPEAILERAKQLGANQITFRILYESEKNTPQDKWIKEHRAAREVTSNIYGMVKECGRPLEMLSFGAIRYACNGLSIVIDDDCMNSEAHKDMKYAILRPDCHLYSKWDTDASRIF